MTIFKIRDRDTQGLVHCAAITEQSEPGVARAEGIAQILIQIQLSDPKGRTQILQKKLEPKALP